MGMRERTCLRKRGGCSILSTLCISPNVSLALLISLFPHLSTLHAFVDLVINVGTNTFIARSDTPRYISLLISFVYSFSLVTRLLSPTVELVRFLCFQSLITLTTQTSYRAELQGACLFAAMASYGDTLTLDNKCVVDHGLQHPHR
mmetsp:Transcript_33736/g.60458  ORF Transcript_33736/g.60458 Transcript_33736/m.60458 type:complete len:146 (-) Transcript_33736:23-460(-)